MIHPYRLLFFSIANCIQIIFPKTIWYQMVDNFTSFSKYIAFTKYQFTLPRQMRKARHMDTLLAFLSRKSDFPISSIFKPYQPKNCERTIICTIHIPLIKVAIRDFIENNENIQAAIIGKKTKDGKMALWGAKTKLNTIVKSPYVLVKTKHILENNGNVLVMVDDLNTGEISPNIFHLAGKVNAQVIYIFSKLMNDGKVMGEICIPPYPKCLSKEEINSNISFLQTKSIEIKNYYANIY